MFSPQTDILSRLKSGYGLQKKTVVAVRRNLSYDTIIFLLAVPCRVSLHRLGLADARYSASAASVDFAACTRGAPAGHDAPWLADEYGVTQKTVTRDLELLHRIGFPLVYETSDHGRKHWRLDGKSGLSQLSFTLEEAAALYLGRQFLEPLAGTDFFHGAQSAFTKIRSTLGDAPLRHLEKLAAAFYCKTHGLADYSQKGELIDEFVRGVEDRRLTVITYQSLRSTEPVTHYDNGYRNGYRETDTEETDTDTHRNGYRGTDTENGYRHPSETNTDTHLFSLTLARFDESRS